MVNSIRESIIKNPSIQVFRRYSLYHSRTLRHTLTNNEFFDNVLVAIVLFLLVILVKDIITRIVYARPRFSVARDTSTYFSQARIVLLDNTYSLRWVWKFQLFDTGSYEQRNHVQYNLVMLAALAMFIMELVLIVPGLPANRLIYKDSDKMVRWDSQYLDKGRIILWRDGPCIVSPLLDGPNLKSESSWRYCRSEALAPSGSSKYPTDRMILRVSNPETSKGYLMLELFSEGYVFRMKYAVQIPVNEDNLAVVGLSDNAATFIRNLQRNFELLRNVTGLTWNTTLQAGHIVDQMAFRVNASRVNHFPDPFSSAKLLNAGAWIAGIVEGILTVRASGNGSQLYEIEGHVNGSTAVAVPLKKTKILVGAYIGTLVPSSFIVAFTAGTVLAHILVFIFLRSPPGGAWELLQAHRRDHGDRILAGPPGNVIKI